MNVQILHGPKLESQPSNKREKKRPGTWFYGARIRAEMATDVDKIAAATGCKPSDVIRTALANFIALAKQDSGNPLPHIDPSSAPAIAQPRLADAYKGNGGSDQHALRQARDRQSQVLARGARGEKLLDKAPSR